MQRIRLPALLGLNFSRRSLGDDHSLVNDGDAIGQCIGFLQIVRRRAAPSCRDAPIARISSHSMRRASTSSPTVGSSRKSRSGSPQIASANSTRCFCPPESSPNFLSANFSSPAMARASPGPAASGNNWKKDRYARVPATSRELGRPATSRRCASGFQDSWGRPRKRVPFRNSAAAIPEAISPRSSCRRR